MPRSRKSAAVALLLVLTLAVAPSLSASPLDLRRPLAAGSLPARLFARLLRILHVAPTPPVPIPPVPTPPIPSGCEMDPNGVLVCKP